MKQSAVTSLLKVARDAVDEADTPTDLRTAAFEKAVDLLAGSLPTREPRRDSPGEQDADLGGGGGDEGALDRVAAKLKLGRELVEEVFDLIDGDLKIVIPTSKLQSSKTGATKQLALLVAAGRQGAGLEEWTDSSEIREVVKEFGKFDTTNFGKAVRAMEEPFRFTGSGQRVKVKVNRRGYEQATELVTAITGGAQS